MIRIDNFFHAERKLQEEVNLTASSVLQVFLHQIIVGDSHYPFFIDHLEGMKILQVMNHTVSQSVPKTLMKGETHLLMIPCIQD